MKKFNIFPNHGDDEGRGTWAVCHGEVNDMKHVVVAFFDRKKEATECKKRLNEIVKQVAIDELNLAIYGINCNMNDVLEPLHKQAKRTYECELDSHKYRIRDIKNLFKPLNPKRK